MENLMNTCVSLNSIKEFVLQHWGILLAVYLVGTYLYGLRWTRHDAAQAEDVNPDVFICCLVIFLSSPVWVPFLLLWNFLDLGGRKLREKQQRGKKS